MPSSQISPPQPSLKPQSKSSQSIYPSPSLSIPSLHTSESELPPSVPPPSVPPPTISCGCEPK